MTIESKNRTKWDALYDPNEKSWFAKLEEAAINIYFSNAFAKAIRTAANIKQGKILEPGCGGGMTCSKFAIQGFNITMMDLSKNALQKAVSRFQEFSLDCKFMLGDLFNIPLKDGQFDIVFNQGVMEHFRLAGLDASLGVKEMLRVLKKDGILIIIVPAYFSPLFFIYKFFKFFKLVDKYWPYTDQDFLHKHELREMMERGDCKNIVVKRLWSSLFFSLMGYCKKD